MLTQLLQTAPAPGGAAGGLVQFLPMIFIFVIFYFLLIAPMRKKQKKAQEMLASLKKGERVITTGGIYGTITNIDEKNDYLVIQIADNGTKIKVLRSAIGSRADEQETTNALTAT
jgi:preprotein translocase subunit YajC